MPDLYTFFARLAGLFRRRERELDDEVRFHLEMETEQQMRSGLSYEDAAAAAKRNFGGVAQIKETYRERRGLPIVEVVIQDILYSIRMIRRRPASYALLLLIFALGIGVNTAVFSVVDGVLLRPLPFPNSDRLVRIWYSEPDSGQRFLEASYREAAPLTEQKDVFASAAAFSTAPRILRDSFAEPVHAMVGRLSDDLSTVLGEPPSAGRTFLDTEIHAGESVVALSHRFWKSRYNGRPDVIGGLITIDDETYQIIGVGGEHDYPRDVDLWRPLKRQEREDDDPELQIIARLKADVTVDQATAALHQPSTGRRFAWIQTLQAMLVRDVRNPLLLQLAAVGLVLLIACVNIANLLLANGWRREKEVAIRAALGASRFRIVRQLLTEALLLASLGGGLGVLAGRWSLDLIRFINPGNIPRLDEVAVDERVLVAMALLTAITGIAAALLPAIHLARPSSAGMLKISAHLRRAANAALREGLVVAEISLATLLLVAAVLVLKSFDRILTLDRGYDTHHVLAVPISLRGNIEKDVAGFYDRVLERVRSIAGVDSAALGMRTPMDALGLKVSFTKDAKAKALFSLITPDYFAVLKIPLVSGRSFDATDRRGSRPVAIINESLARMAFPGENPIGRSMHTDIADNDLLIVGVVGDATPETNSPQGPAIYVSVSQMGTRDMALLVRTSTDPRFLVSTIRSEISALNPAVPLDKIYALDDRLGAARAVPRFHLLLLALFALFALGLASLGIYGVVADWIGEREHEMGIRRALGAKGSELVWMVLRSSLRMTLCGLAIGTLSALWLQDFVRSLLFQVTPQDLTTFFVVAVTLTCTATVASLLPAIRAVRIDPARALRTD